MNQAQSDYANFMGAEGSDNEPDDVPTSRFWISWWQPGEDPRPLHFPPKEARVLGWWESGTDGRRTSICALVSASVEWTAKAAVAEDWPESIDAEWRFVEPKDADWTPGERFPVKPWMAERLAPGGVAVDRHHTVCPAGTDGSALDARLPTK